MSSEKPGKKPHLRRCTGCMSFKEKNELIRLYLTEEGCIAIDRTGKAGGRGAYICKDEECLKKAFKRRALEHGFKMRVSDENKEKLLCGIKDTE